jgi:hypothetical protein
MRFSDMQDFATRMSVPVAAHPKLLVVVPGFGPPMLPLKLSILESNMKRIRAGRPTESVSFRIFCYADILSSLPLSPSLASDAGKLANYTSLFMTMQSDLSVSFVTAPDIVWEFLKSGVHPDSVKASGFNEILIILDDVEVVGDVPWGLIRESMQITGADVASPSLLSEEMSWWFWMGRRM